MKLRDIAGGELTKPFVAKVFAFMERGGLDLSPETVAKFANVDVRDVQKFLSKRKSFKANIPNFSPDVCRVIAGLYLIPRLRKTLYPRMPDAVKAMAKEIGMNEDQVRAIVEQHIDEIRSIHPGFLFDIAFPESKRWALYTLEQKAKMVVNAVTELSGGKLGSVSAAQVAKFLIKTHKLTDEEGSLSRRIDELLSNDKNNHPDEIKKLILPLEKFRIMGKNYRGSIDNYGGIKVW